MTVHQAKGLEFDTVILPFTQNAFDSRRKMECLVRREGECYKVGYHLETTDRSYENDHYKVYTREESLEKIAEETRLFYVACTRAKAHLYALINRDDRPTSKIDSWQDLVGKGKIDV